MAYVIDLQESESVCGPCETLPAIPVFIFVSVELSLVIPIHQQSPGPVTEVVVYEVNAPNIYQRCYDAVQEVGHIRDEILHLVHVKIEVNPHVEQGPLV